MPFDLSRKVVIAVSSTALFDLVEEDRLFHEQGPDAYMRLQWERQEVPLRPGPAFSLVSKFLSLNQDQSEDLAPVEVVLLSRNDAASGLRVMSSIRASGLAITRAAFSQGRSPWCFLKPFSADLFLTTSPEDAREASRAGVAAAVVLPGTPHRATTGELRIGLDGDCCLFGPESEAFFEACGKDVEAFNAQEDATQDDPLTPGPMMGFLRALVRLQQLGLPVRTGLFTARHAPAHARPIKSLRALGVSVDEVVFLGGVAKGTMLAAWSADLFLDDQLERHCLPAAALVTTGHVVCPPAS